MRVKRGTIRAKKRKRLLRKVKGYRWGRKNIPRLAKVAHLKAGSFAYKHRKMKKGDFRSQWTMQVNAAARQNKMSYSKLIHLLKIAKIELNRKILADLAEFHPQIFAAVVEKAAKK